MKTSDIEIRRMSKLALGVTWALVAASLAFAGQVRAANDEDRRIAETEAMEAEMEADLEAAERQLEQAEIELEVREIALESELEDAQLRLEEAARQVAELSAQLVGDATVIALGTLRTVTEPRPMLGINIGQAGNDGNDGVLVEGVTPGGPADREGIRSGDIIVQVDGLSLRGDAPGSGTDLFTDYMGEVDEGQEMVLQIVRDGKPQTVTLVPENMDPLRMVFNMSDDWDFNFEELEELAELEKLGELEALGHRMGSGAHGYRFRLGHAAYWGDMELVTLTPELGEYFGADEGILVVRAPGEEALKLQDGDVIVDIDGRKPGDPAHAMRILRSYDGGEAVKLGIVRKKKRQTLDITLPSPNLGARGPGRPKEPPYPGR
ncbi:MAG: PDZ domain-containing protein [Gammaproteobacteria bacterium]